jgi:hypothetical protein
MVGALALLLSVAVVARPASRMGSMSPEATALEGGGTPASESGFHMRARARGLFPGARRPVRLRITNPNRFAIEVTKVRVRIRRDPKHPGCHPRRYLRATRLGDSVTVPARGVRRTRTRVTIRMRVSAPDACQRAVFPLRLRGTAVKR